jgi:hypothetical protein
LRISHSDQKCFLTQQQTYSLSLNQCLEHQSRSRFSRNSHDVTATLTETSDVTAIAMADSQVSITLAEYGSAVNTTAKLRGTSFLDVDAVAANLIGYNAGSSIDTVVANVLKAATNVIYGGGGSTTPTVERHSSSRRHH